MFRTTALILTIVLGALSAAANPAGFSLGNGGSGMSYRHQVAAGQVPGVRIMSALGQKDNVAIVASGEDIWNGAAATIPIPDAAGVSVTLTSDDAADNIAGTGAHYVTVEYLDVNGDEQTVVAEVIGLGDNQFATGVTFINDMYVSTVGSNGVAEGNISIYLTGSPTVIYNMIEDGGNKSMVPNRMVPNGKTLYLAGWTGSEGSARRTAFRIRSSSTEAGALNVDGDGDHIFLFKGVQYLSKDTSGELALAHKIPAGAIVKVSAWAFVASAEAATSWWGYLVDD